MSVRWLQTFIESIKIGSNFLQIFLFIGLLWPYFSHSLHWCHSKKIPPWKKTGTQNCNHYQVNEVRFIKKEKCAGKIPSIVRNTLVSSFLFIKLKWFKTLREKQPDFNFCSYSKNAQRSSSKWKTFLNANKSQAKWWIELFGEFVGVKRSNTVQHEKTMHNCWNNGKLISINRGLWPTELSPNEHND